MKRVAAFFAPAAALLLGACAGTPPGAEPEPPGALTPRAGEDDARPPAGAAPFATLATRFTARAVKQEAAGDLRRALESWRVVAALRTEATEPKRRVAALKARLAAETEQHFRDGSARLAEGNLDAARRSFLLSLAADPDHAGALEALKNRFEQEAAAYTVSAGDTYESIAKKQYGDAAKAAIVARVNGLDPAGKPAPGTTLALPDIAPPTAKPAGKRPPGPVADAPEPADPTDAATDTAPAALGADAPPAAEPAAPAAPAAPVAPVEPPKPDPAEAQLAKARELFEARKFEEAGAAADRLAGSAAVGARARELSGNAWFAAGEAALKEDRFAEALAAYRKAEPARRDVPAAIAALERRRNEKAEEAYKVGVKHFINQNLDEAIKSWELTLSLNPEHARAPKDIEKARGLQQKLKELR